MGEKSKKNAAFLAKHPICCFCGEPSETIDHIPSRSCFDGRVWPESFEFPSCHQCNSGTRQEEQVIALMSRLLDSPHAPTIPEEIGRYMHGVANNQAKVFEELAAGRKGLSRDLDLIEVGAETAGCFEAVLPRWAKAFHYRETGIVVPVTATIVTRVFTNQQATSGQVPADLFDAPDVPLVRGGKDLSGQFGYIPRTQPDGQVGMYVVVFRRSFGAMLGVDLTGALKEQGSR